MALKRAVVGRPLATAQEGEQRLSKKIALPIFSSDAISSTAYATEEILLALVTAGAVALTYSLPIAIAVSALLFIVATSYRQTIHAYPSGGGSYVVSRENLGLAPGMVAAASLLVDYVMTVAVSTASGVAAITSAFPSLLDYKVYLCVGLILLVAVANLRGVRESGRAFAIPTYAFVVLCGGMIIVGMVRWAMGDLSPVAQTASVEATQGLTLFLILRAFSAGCSAMTGTEAISNAVPAFKPPEAKNAGATLMIMAGTLAFLLLGVTALTQILDIVPSATGHDTVISQVARAVYGDGGFFYFAFQIATMAILILGANTSYAGFPRLTSVLARDGLMPRQFANQGDRLVYSNGVIGLTVIAIIVVVIFGAQTHRMIPLYAVGVFLSFTLSQAGMVVHWFRLKDEGWRRRATMNGVGAALTGIVAVVIVLTKFVHGAYLVVAAVPILVAIFYAINRHYRMVARVLAPQSPAAMERIEELAASSPRTTAVLFVASVNALTARSVSLARALSPDDIHAVTVGGDPTRVSQLRETWKRIAPDLELEMVESPYREFVKPALDYVRSLEPGPAHTVVVVIPEFVVEHWWENLLHNQSALRLKGALFLVPWVVVISIPLHLRVARSRGAGD
jgi:amino acid transporter